MKSVRPDTDETARAVSLFHEIALNGSGPVANWDEAIRAPSIVDSSLAVADAAHDDYELRATLVALSAQTFAWLMELDRRAAR